MFLTTASALAQAADPTPTLDQRLDELDQRVRIAERQREIDAEIAASKAEADKAKQNDGLTLKSSNGKQELNLRGVLHVDARKFVGDDDRKLTDTFVLRRVRPIFVAKLSENVGAYLMPDLGGGGTFQLMDFWVDWKLSDAVRFRFGKQKVPFSFERLQSAPVITFVERAYPTQLGPNRDVGAIVHGELIDKRLIYALGAFNGAADGASTDGDVNDSKELVARLALRPFARDVDDAGKPLPSSQLLVGGAVTYGDQDGTDAAPQLPAWKSPGQASMAAARAGEAKTDAAGKTTALPNVVARGWRLRWTAFGYGVLGPLGVLGEYTAATEPVARGSETGNLRSRAWNVAASWVLGGAPTYEGVKITEPFAFDAPGWGALEIAARASGIGLQGDDKAKWTNPAKSVTQALSATGGIRWHVSPRLRYEIDYEHTVFDDGAKDGDLPTESVVLSRLQLSY